MITHFKAFFTLFQKGKSLSDPSIWANRTNAGNAIIGLFGSVIIIANGFGYEFNIDQQTLEAAGYGIAAIVSMVNGIMLVITNKDVGK